MSTGTLTIERHVAWIAHGLDQGGRIDAELDLFQDHKEARELIAVGAKTNSSRARYLGRMMKKCVGVEFVA